MESALTKTIKATPLKILNMFLGFVIFFLLTPFMIKKLGDYYYGLWVLLNTILSYFALSEFGLVSAVERELAFSLGQKNRKDFNKIFFNGLILFGGVGLLISLLSIISALVMVKFSAQNTFLPLLLLLLGLTAAYDISTQPFYSVLNAHLDFKINYSINILQAILHSSLIFILLSLGYKLFALVLINFLVMTFVKTLQIFMIKIKIQELKLNQQKIDYKIMRRLLIFGGKSFFVKIADIMRSKVDDLIIGAVIGIKKITNYSISYNLTTKGNTFLNSLMEMVSPVFYQLVGAKRQEQLQRTYLFSWKISLLISSMVYAVLVILGYPFIKIWVGQNYLDAYIPLLLLGGAAFVEKTQSPGNTIFFSYNRQHIYGVLLFMEGLANLGLSLFFVLLMHLGINGVALGTLVGAIVTRIFVQPYFVAKLIGFSYFQYHLFFLSNLAKGISIYLISYFCLFKIIKIDNYFTLLGCLLVIILLGAIHSLLVLHRDEQQRLYTEIANIIKNIFNKKYVK